MCFSLFSLLGAGAPYRDRFQDFAKRRAMFWLFCRSVNIGSLGLRSGVLLARAPNGIRRLCKAWGFDQFLLMWYIYIYYIWRFRKMGTPWDTPIAGWFVMEIHLWMDDLGGTPILGNLHIYIYIHILIYCMVNMYGQILIDIYIYTHIYIYTYIYIHTCMILVLFADYWFQIHIYIYTYLHTHVYYCLPIIVKPNIDMIEYMYIYIYIYMYSNLPQR